MAEKVKKADVIRDALRQNGEAGPKQIIEIVKATYPKLKVTPQEVSTYKSKLRAAGEIAGTTSSSVARKPKQAKSTDGSIAPAVAKLEAVISEIGKDKIKQLLDVL